MIVFGITTRIDVVIKFKRVLVTMTTKRNNIDSKNV